MAQFEVIIIGSGAAAYATAYSLLRQSHKSIAIVTDGWNQGTSRNAGSDKQTFYKLSLDAVHTDSVVLMAQSFTRGGSMQGDKAMTLAANSARAFFRLVELGVPFPSDEYGAYIGYCTDHDDTRRATTAGPYTSKYMTEALERAVYAYDCVTTFDNATVLQVVTEEGGVRGVVIYTPNRGIEALSARVVVAATGAPAGIFATNVYPCGQQGMTGRLTECGVTLQNFAEWQFGLASIGRVRWNVSGSYQQVMPRYVSIDGCGQEHEFLTDSMSPSDIIERVFLKGYQWPFDTAKIDGSSLVDMLVTEERRKGNRVYLDFKNDATGMDISALPQFIREYLEPSGALVDTPVERLRRLNPAAYEFFVEHGIDLAQEYVEIAVCAQHNNGGVAVDSQCRTNIDGLYVVGEAAGTFGVYRPGGSALLATQVDGIVAADSIHRRLTVTADGQDTQITEDTLSRLADEYGIHGTEVTRGGNIHVSELTRSVVNLSEYIGRFFGMQRILSAAPNLLSSCDKLLALTGEIGLLGDRELRELLNDIDTLRAMRGYILSAEYSGRTAGMRGGAMVTTGEDVIRENTAYRDKVQLTRGDETSWEQCIPLPDADYAFEKEWQSFEARRRGV